MWYVRSNVSLRLLENFSMYDPGTFWLICPKLRGIETSNFFQRPYFARNMVGFAMDGHIYALLSCRTVTMCKRKWMKRPWEVWDTQTIFLCVSSLKTEELIRRSPREKVSGVAA